MLDLTPTRRAAIDRRLLEDVIIWLTTVSPTGKPHTVPVWFFWEGDSMLIFCEPETKKIRNLRQNPAVTLALDSRDDGEEVIVFEGNVELTSETTMELMTEKYIEKYARLFPRTGSTPTGCRPRPGEPPVCRRPR